MKNIIRKTGFGISLLGVLTITTMAGVWVFDKMITMAGYLATIPLKYWIISALIEIVIGILLVKLIKRK